MAESFKQELSVAGQRYAFYPVDAIQGTERLPLSLKILVENVLRNVQDEEQATRLAQRIVQAGLAGCTGEEVEFMPARVLFQDFTGVPVFVDFATMREACARLGGDPSRINPQIPCDLVIDHSIIADSFGCPTSQSENEAIEQQRNGERYTFLKWAQKSFQNVRIVPPGVGICHQLNIENFAQVAMTDAWRRCAEGETGATADKAADGAAVEAVAAAVSATDEPLSVYFDTLVGTDSHTPTANGIGVLGWGVGGIEAEAAALGQPITQSESFTRLVMQKAQLEPGDIQAESIVTAGEKWTAALPLMNPGNAEIHSVMASLSLPGLVEKQAVLVGNITPGETKEAQFAVIPGKDVSGDFSGAVAVTGTDGNGNPVAFSVPVSLTVENSAEILLSSLRMEISQVQGDLKVGEEGALTATLTNPDPTISFESITLRITDGSGEILPQAADTVYIPALAPGTSYSLSFPVTVLPKAAVSPHSLKFDLSWIANKQTVTQTESYTLPVKQEIRLEQGGLKMASSVIAGDSITLTLPLMNMGKADIINVLATVTLPGITDRQSVLVGTIAPGETRQAQITLTPGKDLSGNYEGSLNVEGTDNDGNPTSFSVPIHLTVEKPVKIAEADDPTTTTKENEKPSYLIYGLAGGCGLLLLLLLLQGFLLRKKIHRLEEDKL